MITNEPQNNLQSSVSKGQKNKQFIIGSLLIVFFIISLITILILNKEKSESINESINESELGEQTMLIQYNFVFALPDKYTQTWKFYKSKILYTLVYWDETDSHLNKTKNADLSYNEHKQIIKIKNQLKESEDYACSSIYLDKLLIPEVWAQVYVDGYGTCMDGAGILQVKFDKCGVFDTCFYTEYPDDILYSAITEINKILKDKKIEQIEIRDTGSVTN